MRDLYINIIVFVMLMIMLLMLVLIVWQMCKLFKKIIIRPDYPEIYEYQKRFMKAREEEFEEVRKDIFKEFDIANLDELYDLETKVNIEIEDINKASTIYSILTIVTFILGICMNVITSNKVENVIETIDAATKMTTKQYTSVYGIEFVFALLLLFVIPASFLVFYTESKKYNKYLVFLKELIKRYKKTKSYKIKSKKAEFE